MPWPKEHKRATRERIVAAAAAAFREQGASDVGVSEVMQRAGLTHGGFYAHFASMDELLADALRHASAETTANLGAELDGIIDTYLSPAHLAHPEHGCPIAALGPELARHADQRVRRTLASGIRKRLEGLRELLPGRTKRQAAGTLACMVGGMILARGMTQAESTEFLADCRAFLRAALA